MEPGRPNRGYFDPTLFARNPQHGRLVQRLVDQISLSLDAHGQQEALLARLITEGDRSRWPDHFEPGQLFLIIDGHQIHAAMDSSRLSLVLAEIVFPEGGESDTAYRRRCLKRASIKMMSSQAHDIFDKVNQVRIWMEEFRRPELPSKRELADTFKISPTEAQRIRTAARLAPEISERIRSLPNPPADEVICMIASYPPDQQHGAFRKLHALPVATARRLLKREQEAVNAEQRAVAGRPPNYVYRLRDPESPIVSIATSLTPQQWKQRGGVRFFWEAIQRIGHSRTHQDRLMEDLD
jgi:hypothetical protein